MKNTIKYHLEWLDSCQICPVAYNFGRNLTIVLEMSVLPHKLEY